MNDPANNKIASEFATPSVAPAKHPAATSTETTSSANQGAAVRIPLTVRTRKIVRLAPPIDNGFRPFRVF